MPCGIVDGLFAQRWVTKYLPCFRFISEMSRGIQLRRAPPRNTNVCASGIARGQGLSESRPNHSRQISTASDKSFVNSNPNLESQSNKELNEQLREALRVLKEAFPNSLTLTILRDVLRRHGVTLPRWARGRSLFFPFSKLKKDVRRRALLLLGSREVNDEIENRLSNPANTDVELKTPSIPESPSPSSTLPNLVFGPELKPATAWIKDKTIIRLASCGFDISTDSAQRQIASKTVLELPFNVITSHQLLERCDSMRCKAEEERHAENVAAAKRLGQICGAPLETCFVLLTAGVICAIGNRDEMRLIWESMEDDPLMAYTTYRPLNAKACAKEVAQNILVRNIGTSAYNRVQAQLRHPLLEENVDEKAPRNVFLGGGAAQFRSWISLPVLIDKTYTRWMWFLVDTGSPLTGFNYDDLRSLDQSYTCDYVSSVTKAFQIEFLIHPELNNDKRVPYRSILVDESLLLDLNDSVPSVGRFVNLLGNDMLSKGIFHAEFGLAEFRWPPEFYV